MFGRNPQTLEVRMLLAADLAPAVFGGWDGPIVISTVTGTNQDAAFVTVNDSVFIDVGWGNFGDASTGGTYRVEVTLDGSIIAQNSSIPDTAPFTGFNFTDLSGTTLSLGSHTVQLKLDTNNQIAENDESNNTLTRTFDVLPPAVDDFGDAPDALVSGLMGGYPTLSADNGARHTLLSGFSLGTQIDIEPDAVTNINGLGDDASNLDDDDGVTINGIFSPGVISTVDVFVTNSAGAASPWLDAWIDFNRDGDWNDPDELVFSGTVIAGSNPIDILTPGGAASGASYARFRLHDGATGLPVDGPAPDGEVEDYVVSIAPARDWVYQGASPTQNAQGENVVPDNQVNGATQIVVAHPTDPNILYIGGVNGGIWKTTNATTLNPEWTPQTDFNESLSMGALAFDPTDGTFNSLAAGTAGYSSFAGVSGRRGLVYVTTDGGASWVNRGSAGLTAGNISGIAMRGNTIVVTSSTDGVFRSTDGGATFT
ncbi:MAG: hypothetical protein KDA89_14985, partial [Planctomycetaceae bacterium]|nr:hypothetical protein [Planctomycetaceae bacterium]